MDPAKRATNRKVTMAFSLLVRLSIL